MKSVALRPQLQARAALIRSVTSGECFDEEPAHNNRQHDIGQAGAEIVGRTAMNTCALRSRTPPPACQKREGVETVLVRSTETAARIVLCSSNIVTLNIVDHDAGDAGFHQARFVHFLQKAFTLVRHASG